MGDQDISLDRRDLQVLLRNVTPKLADAQAQLDYLRAMTCTKSAADKALALQQAAAAAGDGDGGEVSQSLLAAAEAELSSLADDLCATPPRLQLPPPPYWPSWWWPWPWPPPWEGAGPDPAGPQKDLSAAVLLACGAQLQEIADLAASHARHEPFLVHARHEPFAAAAGRLLNAGLAALSHDRGSAGSP
jgi:hypothetical protein